uniref:Uncharacterized protein n=1 Tax=Oryzias latipes TaxID=8090 RepID=A0A3P9JLV1_ORYLA
MFPCWFPTTARSCKRVPALVNAQTHQGESACYLAAQQGHGGVVRLLLKAHEGHMACVDLLLDLEADPNQACSNEWPQLPIHAAQFSDRILVLIILRRLLDVTDPGGQPESTAMLLNAGYSPCSLGLRHHSPEDWIQVFVSDSSQLLQLILQHQCFLRNESPSAECSGRRTLTLQELRRMLSVAGSCSGSACLWVPVLLSSGLEPSFLLQPHLFQEADSEALNHLLEFVNWATLPPPIRLILEQRRAGRSWETHAHFYPPSLTSAGYRSALGPDLLMRSGAIQQLPVPPPPP